MPTRPITDAQATLGALLRRPYEAMSDWLYAELATQGFEVRPAFSAVLRNLPPEGARASDLAARAGMTKQSMAYLIEQMRTAGLVAIEPHARDRRANTVRLTLRGEEALAAGIALSRRYEAHLVELVGERRMAQLRATLLELYQRLDDGPVAPEV